jgi:predicted permease
VNEFQTVLQAVLPVFSVAAIGFFIRRRELLSEATEKNLLDVLINVFVPCLIFQSVLGNEALHDIRNVALAPLSGFFAISLGLVVGRGFAAVAGVKGLKGRRTFATCVGIFNWGYVPLPLAATLFDKETVGVLFVFITGAEMAVWTVGVMTLTGGSFKEGLKKVINAPFVTIVVTLSLNFILGADAASDLASGEKSHFAFIMKTAGMLGQCAIPIGLILVGASLSDKMGEFRNDIGLHVMAASVVLRLGLLGFLFVLLAKYVPGSIELKRVLLIQSAMPAAMFPIILAKRYDGDVICALQVAIATTLVSLVTIPLWIPFWMNWVGL